MFGGHRREVKEPRRSVRTTARDEPLAGSRATESHRHLPRHVPRDGLLTGDQDQAWFWIRFLLVYDALFVVSALWTFESVVIE